MVKWLNMLPHMPKLVGSNPHLGKHLTAVSWYLQKLTLWMICWKFQVELILRQVYRIALYNIGSASQKGVNGYLQKESARFL